MLNIRTEILVGCCHQAQGFSHPGEILTCHICGVKSKLHFEYHDDRIQIMIERIK